jgi:hypothetical protein
VSGDHPLMFPFFYTISLFTTQEGFGGHFLLSLRVAGPLLDNSNMSAKTGLQTELPEETLT